MIKYSHLKTSIYLIIFSLFITNASFANQNANYKIVDDIAIHLGLIPSTLIQGHPKEHTEATMHKNKGIGKNRYHLVIALFDSTSKKRITDAKVTATIQEVGFAGKTKKLEPMKIANTITYGNYFKLNRTVTYNIFIKIYIPSKESEIKVKFIR